MENPHAAHPSGLPVAQDERGWCVRLTWARGDLWLRGIGSESELLAMARAVLAAACETAGLGVGGEAGDLLARLRGQ